MSQGNNGWGVPGAGGTSKNPTQSASIWSQSKTFSSGTGTNKPVWGAKQINASQAQESEVSAWGGGAGFGKRRKKNAVGSSNIPGARGPNSLDNFWQRSINAYTISTIAMSFSDKLPFETDDQKTCDVQNILFNECFSEFPPMLVRYFDYYYMGRIQEAKVAFGKNPANPFKTNSGSQSALSIPIKDIEPWELSEGIIQKQDPIKPIPDSTQQPFGVLPQSEYSQVQFNPDINEAPPEITNIRPLSEDHGFGKPPVLADMIQKGIIDHSATPGLITALIARKNPVESVPLIQDSMFSKNMNLSLSSSNELEFLPPETICDEVYDLSLSSQFGTITFNGPISPNFVYTEKLVSFSPGQINVKKTNNPDYDLIPTLISLNQIFGELNEILETCPDQVEIVNYDDVSKTLSFIVPSFDFFPISFASFYVNEP